MSVDLRSHPIRIRHRLSAALRFVDAFTGRPITLPLQVSATTASAARTWLAVSPRGSDLHRFHVTNDAIEPTGDLAITVVAPGGEYVNPEPFTLHLPRPATGASGLSSIDYLLERPLWPTRALRLPDGETAVVGSVRSTTGTGVAGLRVHASGNGSPLPRHGYTDAAGEFVLRLPSLRRSAPKDGPRVVTASITFELRSPPMFTGLVPVLSPIGPSLVQIGRIETLQITVPA